MTENRPPPLLLFASLAFWGWQTDFLAVGIIMGAILESARWIKTRWDFSDEDFRRIWTFCALVLLAATVYAFTSNEGVKTFSVFVSDPSLHSQRNVGTSTAHAVASLVRWLPMVFFLFVGAQVFSLRNGVPLETISLIMRRRWRKARKRGKVVPPGKVVNVCYPYLGICLLAASVHAEEDKSYFWGLCVLLGWAMWPHRSKRGGLAPWAIAMGIAVTVGYFGQIELSRLQRYVETLNVFWFTGGGTRGTQADQTQTALGQIGRIKTSTSIVIRLETPENTAAPTLLREASYRSFKSRTTWAAGETNEDFLHIPETNDTTYVLLPQKQDHKSVTVSCYLPGGNGLLPVPQPASRLDQLFVYSLEKNPAGALRAQGPGMVIFNATYGSGKSIDSDPDPKEDLGLKLIDVPAVDEAIKQMKFAGTNHLEILNGVAGFFSANFAYQTWQDQPALPETSRNRKRGYKGFGGGWGGRTNRLSGYPGRMMLNSNTNREEEEQELALIREHLGDGFWETPLDRFLLKSRKGHCEYFATATVLILRRLGIPARYAVGYSVHEGSGNKYVVRQRDAHAWCLVWSAEKRAWEDFDTTPASWVEAEDAHGSPFRALQDFWSNTKFLVAKIWWGQSHMRQYLLYALFPLLCFLLYQILFRRRRKHRQGESKFGANVIWPGLDSEFYQLEKKLAERGLRRHPSQSLSDWMASLLAEPELAASSEPLRRLLALHYRYRFDPAGLDANEREVLGREARLCLASL